MYRPHGTSTIVSSSQKLIKSGSTILDVVREQVRDKPCCIWVHDIQQYSVRDRVGGNDPVEGKLKRHGTRTAPPRIRVTHPSPRLFSIFVLGENNKLLPKPWTWAKERRRSFWQTGWTAC
jgi:hypothetical protein